MHSWKKEFILSITLYAEFMNTKKNIKGADDKISP